MVPEALHYPDIQVRPRQGEHTCRLSEQGPHGPPNRVDVGSQCPEPDLEGMAQAPGRPFCDKVQQTSPTVRVPSPGPRGLGNRRPVDKLGEHGNIRLSTIPNSRKGIKKSKRRRRSSHSHSPKMASTSLVPRASVSLPRPSSGVTPEPKVLGATSVRRSSRKSRKTPLTRMALVRETLSSRGASSAVVRLVEHAHRSGTQGTYKSHWRSWRSWCSEKSVSPSDPSQLQLAN